MNSGNPDNGKMLVILPLVILLTKIFEHIPWWGFTIPVFVVGLVSARLGWKVSSFYIGFLSGFITWIGSYLLFHLFSAGVVLNKNAIVPLAVILIAVGIMGGLLAGLAFYCGRVLFRQPDEELVF